MKTDTSEKGLEALIVGDMRSLGGWIVGNPNDYDRSFALDLIQLRAFVAATQPALTEAFDLDNDSPTRQKFLARLQGEITKRGVIDVLRKGVKHGAHSIDLFYGTPTPGNTKAEERYAVALTIDVAPHQPYAGLVFVLFPITQVKPAGHQLPIRFSLRRKSCPCCF